MGTKQNKFIAITLLCICFFAMYRYLQANNTNKIIAETGYIPEDGFVPNAETAIKIAEAIWLPIYGEQVLDKKPYKTILVDDTWHVYGSLPENAKGGVPLIEIRKSDCKILKVTHGK